MGWPAGSTLAALRRNVRDAGKLIADLDPVAVAVRSLVSHTKDGFFTGLVSTLYALITERVDPDTRRAPGWPRGAARFGEHLRRLAPALRDTGIDITEKRTTAGMMLEIRSKSGDVGDEPSLLDIYQKKREERATSDESPETGEVNFSGLLPTSPTSSPGNGGNPGLSAHPDHVGDVGNVGATYMPESQAAPGFPADHVGDVGKNGTKFIPRSGTRRIII